MCDPIFERKYSVMPSLSEKDRLHLEHILICAGKIRLFTRSIPHEMAFFENDLIYDATLMNFLVLGEEVVKMSKRLKTTYPMIEWEKIKGFRNFIAHDYFGISIDTVWQVIKVYLPALEQDVKDILSKHPLE